MPGNSGELLPLACSDTVSIDFVCHCDRLLIVPIELILSGAKELKRAIGEQGLIVSNFSLKTMPKLRLSGVYGGLDKLDMGFDKKA